jgi:hypothetical protein
MRSGFWLKARSPRAWIAAWRRIAIKWWLHVEAEPATASSTDDEPAQAAIELEEWAIRVSRKLRGAWSCDASV